MRTMGAALPDLAVMEVSGDAMTGLGLDAVMVPQRVGATLTAVATTGRPVAMVTMAVLWGGDKNVR